MVDNGILMETTGISVKPWFIGLLLFFFSREGFYMCKSITFLY